MPSQFLRPIIADGDAGHGGLTAVMKLTKMFIEAGAAGGKEDASSAPTLVRVQGGVGRTDRSHQAPGAITQFKGAVPEATV